MTNALRYLRAVLWAAIGLGGRRVNAEKRVDKAGLLPLAVIALVLVLAFIFGLLALAKLAVGGV